MPKARSELAPGGPHCIPSSVLVNRNTDSSSSGFEEVEGDRSKILCRICTDANPGRANVVIVRNSKYGHEKSNAHKEAVKLSSRHSEAAMGPAAEVAPAPQQQREVSPVVMPAYPTVSRLLEAYTGGRPLMQTAPGLLDQVRFEGGRVFDMDGDEVMMGGPYDDSVALEAQRHNNHLRSCLEDMSLYQDSMYAGVEEDFPDDEDDENEDDRMRQSLGMSRAFDH